MRNAAMILGIVAGLIGMIVGFFGYGFVALIDQFGEIEGIAEQVDRTQHARERRPDLVALHR